MNSAHAMTQSVLWDLDGTLADTVDDIARTIDAMLAASGLPQLGSATVRAMVGGGAAKLVDLAVRAAGAEPTAAHLETFRALYRANPRGTATLYSGIAEILADVTVPQAVVTNKPADVSAALIGLFGIAERFGAIVGGDTLAYRKPDPQPVHFAMMQLGVRSAVLIGDSPQDVGAAAAAGIPSIGVTWGILQPTGATEIVTTRAELRQALARRGACRYR